jgi:hypothetical protein
MAYVPRAQPTRQQPGHRRDLASKRNRKLERYDLLILTTRLRHQGLPKPVCCWRVASERRSMLITANQPPANSKPSTKP